MKLLVLLPLLGLGIVVGAVWIALLVVDAYDEWKERKRRNETDSMP